VCCKSKELLQELVQHFYGGKSPIYHWDVAHRTLEIKLPDGQNFMHQPAGDFEHIPSSSRKVEEQRVAVPSSSRKVEEQRVAVPFSSRKVEEQRVAVPSSSRKVEEQRVAVPSSSRKVEEQRAAGMYIEVNFVMTFL
jgi:hypothetical protein